MSKTNSSELRGAARQHLRRANRRILKENKENLNPTPTIEVQRLEDEIDLFEIDWEQQMNDLKAELNQAKAELNQAKEDKKKFENLFFQQEIDLVIKPLVNEMVESIIKEVDDEMKQNLNQEKRKKRKLD